MINVEVQLYSQSQGMKFFNVENTYTKDGLFCIRVAASNDGTPEGRHPSYYKFPVQHIFRIAESKS